MVGGLFLGLWIYLKCVNFSRSYVSFVSCSSYFFFGGGGYISGIRDLFKMYKLLQVSF